MNRQRLKYVAINIASARGVAERWAQSYQHPVDGWRTLPLAGGKSAKTIHEKLCSLGPSPSLHDVAEVIGNKSWSYIRCDSCGDEVEIAVSLGEYEPKQYCEVCLQEAVTALSGAKGGAA